MGIPICKYTNENQDQNILTLNTNYPVLDESNNNRKHRKKYCNRYFLNYKTSHIIKPHLETQNENIDIININKGFTNSKNHSSSYLYNADTNQIFDKSNNLSSESIKKKSIKIKNLDNYIKSFSEFIIKE